MITSYNLSQWVVFFFIYSFIGWIWESCYVSVRKHHWVNRGFMHGPMLPLYGSGAIVVLVFTIGLRNNPVLIFFSGMAAATIIEYITGAVMERMFHVKYWDYSNQKLNLNGYICATSSICWGFFSVLLVKAVHIPIEEFVLGIPLLVTDVIALIFSVAAAVDFTQSFNEAMDMKRILAQLEDSRKQISKLQEKLKTASFEAAADYRRHLEERQQKKLTRKQKYLERINIKREERSRQLAELSGRIEQLLREELPSKVDELIGQERREELISMKNSIMEEVQKMGSRTDKTYLRVSRMLRRNPGAVSKRFSDALEELKNFVDNK